MIELINMSDAHIQNVRKEIMRLETEAQNIRNEVARLEQYVDEAAVTVEKYRSEINKESSGDQPVLENFDECKLLVGLWSSYARSRTFYYRERNFNE